ncbi:unnamed protein product [Leptosia nina]|uniref:Uncharacterized protein n=1 Tax=Leptosia nina TaxID=320188 RepID=A0AAV1JKD3_9NEOP
MTEKRCCIDQCFSSTSRKEDIGVTYHKYPKNVNLFNSWIQATHVAPVIDNSGFVCSRHFRKSDFRIYQESKYVLKTDATPSIFPWTMTDSQSILPPEDCHREIEMSERNMGSEPKKLDMDLSNDDQLLDPVTSEEFANMSVKALDVIHKSQEMPVPIAPNVMDFILNKSYDKTTNGHQNAEVKSSLPQGDKGAVALTIGSKVEAKDFSCQWHTATISEVDYDEMEVLVHFEESKNMHDEWISVSSSRLRPYNPSRISQVSSADMPPKHVNNEDKKLDERKASFQEGERCLARWRDNRRFMATVHKVLADGQYEIIFDDGFHWKCSTARLSKAKDSSGKSFDALSIDTSMSPHTSALSPLAPGMGPLGTPSPLGTQKYDTHLFDPTRDYLGSKSERREMKRKLNIKEIFNIGQKKRKIKQDDGATKEKVKVLRKSVIKSEPETDVKEVPDAVASIIGTFDEKAIKLENSQANEDKHVKEDSDKITLNDLLGSENLAQASTLSEISDSDLNSSTDSVTKEEEMLEKFDKPDEGKHEEVIDKMKEVISKLEGGLSEIEAVVKKKPPSPDIGLEVIQVDPNALDIDEVEETVKMKVEAQSENETLTQEVSSTSSNTVVKTEKPKKAISKVKKGKKMRLLQDKKVKKQVERVKNELEEMKRQVAEMRKQMLQKTEALAIQKKQQHMPQEMPESFLLPGEWCCRWVNGEPVGEVHETETEPKFDANNKPALPRRTVLVEDKRLPEGWKKIMVRRSLGLSAGKWDVVLVSPDNKRFHTKHEMRNYLDLTAGELKPYEYALLDFGVHLKLSRRMGWVTHSGTRAAPVSNTSPFFKKKLSIKKDMKNKRLKIRKPTYIIQGLSGTSGEADNDIPVSEPQDPPIEDGYVYVGSLKVQVIDNLLRCPAEGCLKNFRNNTLLKMHIKHYHRELKKMLGDTPKVLDLAYARHRPILGSKVRKPKENRVLKVKIPRLPKSLITPQPEVVKTEIPTEPVTVPPVVPEEQPAAESPKLRQALIPKPVKRPKVLLPVRRTNPEPLVDDVKEEIDTPKITPPVEIVDCVDFEAAISTHTVTKPEDYRKLSKPPRSVYSEDEEWPTMNSDFETRSSFPGSGTPDSKTMDKPTNPVASSESNEEAKGGEMYMFTETGERIKIERMKREEIINCHCGFREEDGLMVQCELCLCWQHALCHNIQRESEVPEKYTCSICLNPKGGRRSKRFLHDQDRLYEGLLPGAKPCEFLRRSHELSGNLLRIQDALHAMRVKYHVATKKNHPKLYLWAKDWENAELNFAQERINSDYSDLNIIINNIGKENLPVKPAQDGDEREPLLNLSGVPLDFPITTSELERMARTMQEQESRVLVPQPEAAIENSACRERLLRHIQRCQAVIDGRLDSIEAQVAELESQDPSFEDDETADYCPRTKQTIQMLMRDLETMEELGVIT